MPAFPGMGYPLVPGYETVGTVVSAGAGGGRRGRRDTSSSPARTVSAPCAACTAASASRLVAPGARVVPIDADLGERGVLLALAATALHALEDRRVPKDRR